MGSFFSASSKNSNNQKGSSTPTFSDPRAQGLLDSLTKGTQGTPQMDDKSGYLQGIGNQKMIESLGGQAQQVDATGALNAIRSASAAQTPVDVANIRSQFYNKPTGRNDIAVADTVARNASLRDAALYNTQMSADQFNANAQNQREQQNATLGQTLSNYMSPEQQEKDRDEQRQMQLLALLRGESTTGTMAGSGSSDPSKASILGNILGTIGSGVAAYYTGGASLAAQQAAAKK